MGHWRHKSYWGDPKRDKARTRHGRSNHIFQRHINMLGESSEDRNGKIQTQATGKASQRALVLIPGKRRVVDGLLIMLLRRQIISLGQCAVVAL